MHGHTHSQNPLSCAIGNAVLDSIRKHDLVRRSAKMGDYLLDRMQSLYEIPIVRDVRGLGLFCGVELVRDRQSKAPFDPESKVNILITNKAFEKGLVVYPGSGGVDGFHGDHVLVAPPFIITWEQTRELVAILKESIQEVAEEVGC